MALLKLSLYLIIAHVEKDPNTAIEYRLRNFCLVFIIIFKIFLIVKDIQEICMLKKHSKEKKTLLIKTRFEDSNPRPK